MANELDSWIEKQLYLGYSKEEIKEILITEGHSPSVVDSAIVRASLKTRHKLLSGNTKPFPSSHFNKYKTIGIGYILFFVLAIIIINIGTYVFPNNSAQRNGTGLMGKPGSDLSCDAINLKWTSYLTVGSQNDFSRFFNNTEKTTIQVNQIEINVKAGDVDLLCDDWRLETLKPGEQVERVCYIDSPCEENIRIILTDPCTTVKYTLPCESL